MLCQQQRTSCWIYACWRCHGIRLASPSVSKWSLTSSIDEHHPEIEVEFRTMGSYGTVGKKQSWLASFISRLSNFEHTIKVYTPYQLALSVSNSLCSFKMGQSIIVNPDTQLLRNTLEVVVSARPGLPSYFCPKSFLRLVASSNSTPYDSVTPSSTSRPPTPPPKNIPKPLPDPREW